MTQQKTISQDYQTAKVIANSLNLLHDTTVTIDEPKRFRRYLTDLGKFESKKFSTRSISDNTLQVVRIQ